MPFDVAALNRLARRQGGCLTRPQVLAAGGTPTWLRGRVGRRQWRRAHPGVYVTFTGPMPWRTRAWAALLYAGPGAVLAFEAAGHQIGLVPKPPATVDVCVPATRRVRNQPGVRVHARKHILRDRVLDDPPRMRVAPTVLDLVTRCLTADAVVSVVTVGVRCGMHPDAVLDLLEGLPAHRWRGLVRDVLADADAGVESTLEWHYHHRVERDHGLPRFELQSRQKVGGRWIRADRRHKRYRLRVELDGELAHPGGRTDEDTWRDNDVVIDVEETTLRYRWRHVVGGSCRTASQVVRALRKRGWTGTLRACGPNCTVLTRFDQAM